MTLVNVLLFCFWSLSAIQVNLTPGLLWNIDRQTFYRHSAQVSLSRGGQGRITAATDPDGGTVRYRYIVEMLNMFYDGHKWYERENFEPMFRGESIKFIAGKPPFPR